MFRIYKTFVVFDRKHFNEVWIDPHYQEKHRESITDELILGLIQRIGGRAVMPVSTSEGFYYYEFDVTYQQKLYRMIVVRPFDDSYLGIRNAYRRSK